MTDKSKPFAVPTTKVTKTKRLSTVSAATSSRMKVPSTQAVNEKPKAKFNKNVTIIGEGDVTMLKTEDSTSDFDAESYQIAYNEFLYAMLGECLCEEKKEREETELDIQISQLANRFQETIDVLDKTNKRLKNVSFVVEQKRLSDLISNDSTHFYETTDNSNAQNLLHNLVETEQACYNKLDVKNIDFGVNKESGHKQLLDAVNDAIDGLEQIKKHSNLDTHLFEEYDKSQKSLEKLEKERLDIDSLKVDFEEKFPKFSEKLLKEASEKIAKMFENDVDD